MSFCLTAQTQLRFKSEQLEQSLGASRGRDILPPANAAIGRRPIVALS